jgi:hypothetical protein
MLPVAEAPAESGTLLAAFGPRESRPRNRRGNEDTGSEAGTNDEELLPIHPILPIHVSFPSQLSASGVTVYQ